MEMDADGFYFILENRLDSFQGPQPVSKGKASTAGGRGSKATSWPHKTLSPVALAKAGFFFQPHPKSPDNVVCFLCQKSLDGWEETDNPLEEHLKHSPTCGWAITAAIEAGYGNYGKVPPLDPAMIEARKATFGGRWPYESKKGFKCKTKKLVEAGWKFTPSREADDMATCAYCNLALEGWEAGDNPFDEHYRREPGCLFFALSNQYPAQKKGRTKAGRTSKASSRLSVQSVATVATTASDLASAADITADHDDSVMTTASTMTQNGKKTAKGRKATAGKARNTKAKKEEASEAPEDNALEPPRPASRGQKRASDAMEDVGATNAEAPAPKKRATRGRASAATDNSYAADTEMIDVPTQQPVGKKKRASSTKATRKVSDASARSQASAASLRDDLPDDDELDRQLEADLERYQSASEDVVEQPAPAPARGKGRPKKASTVRKVSAQKKKGQSESFVMFDPTPMVPDEAEIEADLEALQAEMEPEREPPVKEDTLVVPKKGRKPGTRKVSKQAKKPKEPEPEPEPTAEEEPGHTSIHAGEESHAAVDPEPAGDPDASTGTVITKPAARPSLEKRKRGRPSKKSNASQVSVEATEEQRYADAPEQITDGLESMDSGKPPARKSTPENLPKKAVPSVSHGLVSSRLPAPTPAVATPPRVSKALAAPVSSTGRPRYPPSASRTPIIAPSTPRARASPSSRTHHQHHGSISRSALGTAPASTTPQSEAEPHYPSLQPAASVIPKRVALAPLHTAGSQTPQRNIMGSPSKRNAVAGLQSSHPWHPADLDLIFSSSPIKSPYSRNGDVRNDGYAMGYGKENTAQHAHHKHTKSASSSKSVAALLRRGAELTSPEKKMTVEQWIYHNAGLAEQKLKRECEAMVAAFEAEGERAMTVLEGLVVEG
ncbi:hypothetical protein B0J18DRAFT_487007 [Chaetomium sp. MPI-SDFR-AT-0129]|nr:hypothetical protein B0J18DRAFT_487007 [Chaetomium sp. MPI-SDFR-AT-0129]